MNLFEIYSLLIISLLVIATISKTGFWPFSNYPMFATEKQIFQVQVYRISLVMASGEEKYWVSRFQHHQQHFAKRFYKRRYKNGTKNIDQRIVAILFNITKTTPKDVRFIKVYERSIADSSKMKIRQKEILKIAINDNQNVIY